jgi:hypothetical protein
MRRDEIEARREQKKHLMVELRSLGSRYDDGKAWKEPHAALAEAASPERRWSP